MPIVSDIAGLGNFIINIFKTLIENPLLFVLFIFMIFIFPLNVIDFLLFVLVNIFIAIMNILIWIVITLPNIIFAGFNSVSTAIFDDALWEIIPGDQPSIVIPLIPYSTIPYINFDFFGEQETLLGILIDNLGLSFPLW